MEALASFGGADFGSLPVRKIDLHTELKREAEEMKWQEEAERGGAGGVAEEVGQPRPKRPRTRSASKKKKAKPCENY